MRGYSDSAPVVAPSILAKGVKVEVADKASPFHGWIGVVDRKWPSSDYDGAHYLCKMRPPIESTPLPLYLTFDRSQLKESR